jgi:hypothetical protein
MDKYATSLSGVSSNFRLFGSRFPLLSALPHKLIQISTRNQVATTYIETDVRQLTVSYPAPYRAFVNS